jgi:hypothetical protein
MSCWLLAVAREPCHRPRAERASADVALERAVCRAVHQVSHGVHPSASAVQLRGSCIHPFPVDLTGGRALERQPFCARPRTPSAERARTDARPLRRSRRIFGGIPSGAACGSLARPRRAARRPSRAGVHGVRSHPEPSSLARIVLYAYASGSDYRTGCEGRARSAPLDRRGAPRGNGSVLVLSAMTAGQAAAQGCRRATSRAPS